MKRAFSSIISLLVLAVCLWLPGTGQAMEVVIFHTNDMHSRVTTEDDGGKSIGLAEMSAAVQAARTANPNVLWLDAGDTLHGTPRINISRGRHAVTLLNESGLNLMAPGNHDFNYGADRLLELEQGMDFSLISANVYDRETGERLFAPSAMLTLEDGLRIGVFGLTTPETAYKTNPANVEQVMFQNPVEAAQEMVEELRSECDILIAVMHMGVDKSSTFTSERIANEAPGIDVIIDGHSHTMLPQGILVGDTLIAQSGCHGYRLGQVKLTVEDKRVTAKEARLLDAEAVAKLAPQPNEKILAEMKRIDAENDALFSEWVAYSERHLTSERAIVRTREAELGNLSADAFRWDTGADIAIVNGGSLRADLPAGDVTKGNIMAIYPFGNTVQVVEISGATVRAMLERSVFSTPAAFGGFLHVSGMTFSFDPSQPTGHRVQEIYIGGEPLEEDKIYLMASNDFMFVGGDGYDMLLNLPVVAEFSTAEEILADYLNAVGMEGIEVGRITVLGEKADQAA